MNSGGEAGRLAEARTAVVRAALAHVPFDGWTYAALRKGRRDAVQQEGVDPAMAKIAVDSLADLAEAYGAYADARMAEAVDAAALAEMGVRERIAHVVRVRLTQAGPEREAVRALMAYLALPGNQALALRLTYRTVDAIWRAIGDTSTDFAFYTKRATLAAVLGATVLYWLSDDSEGFSDTFAFLGRRIEGVMRIEKAKGRFREARERLPDPFRAYRRARRTFTRPGA